MSRVTVPAVATAVVLLGVLPSSALAERPATPEERAAILAGIDPRREYCFSAVVASADAAWGLYTTATPRPVGCDVVGDGFALVHRDPTGAWTVVLESAGEQGPCPGAGIPTAVGVDLEVCHAPIPRSRTKLTCFPRSKARAVPQPTNCRTGGPASRPIRLTGLRWRHWGRYRATATGRTEQGRARVEAYRPVVLGGERFYTRLRVVGGGWRATVAVAAPWGEFDY